jgi:hypothetical protein
MKFSKLSFPSPPCPKVSEGLQLDQESCFNPRLLEGGVGGRSAEVASHQVRTRKPCRASLTPAARRQALGLVYLISSSSQRFISQNALLQLIQLPTVGQVTDHYVRHTPLHFAFPRPPWNSSPAHSHFLFRRPIKVLEILQSLIFVFLVAPPIAWSFWELQFESRSRPGGVFGSHSVPGPSKVELQVPESLEKAVVKLPVELAQDDSWRMESGNGSGFW